MDKEILIEYNAMKQEIKDLRRRIDEDTKELEKLNELIVSDSVTCGKKGKKPIRTVKIQGRPTAAITQKQKLLENRIERMGLLERKLIELTDQAEQYIEDIEKAELRIMFRYYFLDDMTYADVAKEMNRIFPKRKTKYSDENVKKKIQRFFKNFENVPLCPEKV